MSTTLNTETQTYLEITYYCKETGNFYVSSPLSIDEMQKIPNLIGKPAAKEQKQILFINNVLYILQWVAANCCQRDSTENIEEFNLAIKKHIENQKSN